MKIGKIKSSVGKEVIAPLQLDGTPLDERTAKGLVGSPVSLEGSGQRFNGRVSGVIGRTDQPYVVASSSPPRPERRRSYDKKPTNHRRKNDFRKKTNPVRKTRYRR